MYFRYSFFHSSAPGAPLSDASAKPAARARFIFASYKSIHRCGAIIISVVYGIMSFIFIDLMPYAVPNGEDDYDFAVLSIELKDGSVQVSALRI